MSIQNFDLESKILGEFINAGIDEVKKLFTEEELKKTIDSDFIRAKYGDMRDTINKKIEEEIDKSFGGCPSGTGGLAKTLRTWAHTFKDLLNVEILLLFLSQDDKDSLFVVLFKVVEMFNLQVKRQIVKGMADGVDIKAMVLAAYKEFTEDNMKKIKISEFIGEFVIGIIDNMPIGRVMNIINVNDDQLTLIISMHPEFTKNVEDNLAVKVSECLNV